MKAILSSLVLVAALPSFAQDIIQIGNGYDPGVYSVSVMGETASELLPEVVSFYIDAGAKKDPQGKGVSYNGGAAGVIIDGGPEENEVMPRYTWNFNIPHAQITSLIGGDQGLSIEFEGPTAEYLVTGMKKAVASGRAKVVATVLDEEGREDGHSYEGKVLFCTEAISKKVSRCSLSFFARE